MQRLVTVQLKDPKHPGSPQIPYYVPPDFDRRYSSDRSSRYHIEEAVYNEYAEFVGQNCQHEMETKQRKIAVAQRRWDKVAEQAIRETEMENCEEFYKIFGKNNKFRRLNSKISKEGVPRQKKKTADAEFTS